MSCDASPCHCRDWENYEKLKTDNREFRRRLKEKHAKISQLEGVLLDVSRDLEAERASTMHLQRQMQAMASHERELVRAMCSCGIGAC